MQDSLFALIENVRKRLLARPELFEVSAIDLAAPVSTPDLDAVERQLGVSIPPYLRAHYTQVAGATSFYWEVRPGRFRDLGYGQGLGEGGEDEENDEGHGQTPRGRLQLVAPSQFGRWRIPGLAQFTNADGDGWAIEAAHVLGDTDETAIVWFDHDVPAAPRRVVYRSAEALFAALAAEGFAVEGDADGIRDFLART